jgi:hypothetical protein
MYVGYTDFYWLQFFWLLLNFYVCRHNIHTWNILLKRTDYSKGQTIKSAPGNKKVLPGATKSAPQSTIFCTMISMAKASRANHRPPNPLPTLLLPPTHHQHHSQCRQPPPRQLLPDNNKCRSATTSPINTAIVNVTAPMLPLHRPPPPRRRLRPLHGLRNAFIGRGRNLMSLRPQGQRQQQWLRQRQCVGEGKRPGKGKGGRWTLVHTMFSLAEWQEGGGEG